MRAFGLVVSLVLLGVGLYRLFLEQRALSRSAPRPRDTGKPPAAPVAKTKESPVR